MKAVERTIYELCQEIDMLREEAKYWKELFEAERKENMDNLNKRLKESKKGVAQALMFALSVKDDEHGNLILPKENRKELAQHFKS